MNVDDDSTQVTLLESVENAFLKVLAKLKCRLVRDDGFFCRLKNEQISAALVFRSRRGQDIEELGSVEEWLRSLPLRL
jgi:hypothetical protein